MPRSPCIWLMALALLPACTHAPREAVTLTTQQQARLRGLPAETGVRKTHTAFQLTPAPLGTSFEQTLHLRIYFTPDGLARLLDPDADGVAQQRTLPPSNYTWLPVGPLARMLDQLSTYLTRETVELPDGQTLTLAQYLSTRGGVIQINWGGQLFYWIVQQR